MPGRGWLLTAVCGEVVTTGAALCGADGKALDGFRCGLDASKYRAAAWAACCGLMPVAVGGSGPLAMPWGNEVGRNTMARAICPSDNGGKVLGAGVVAEVALPVAPLGACWVLDTAFAAVVPACAEERGCRIACRPLSVRCRIRLTIVPGRTKAGICRGLIWIVASPVAARTLTVPSVRTRVMVISWAAGC